MINGFIVAMIQYFQKFKLSSPNLIYYTYIMSTSVDRLSWTIALYVGWSAATSLMIKIRLKMDKKMFFCLQGEYSEKSTTVFLPSLSSHFGTSLSETSVTESNYKTLNDLIHIHT